MLPEEDLLFVRKFLNTISPNPGLSSVFPKERQTPMIDLRIVVPCYNVEKYVDACLQSIVNQQTNYKWDVICINDGSTDKTGEILNSYANHGNVHIIHQENRGFSGARNRGLEKTDCRYFMFVDSDDILCENTVEEMLQIATQHNADLVEGNFKTFSREDELYFDWQDSATIREIKSAQLSGYAWGKIIKSDLMQNIIFPEGYWYEDSVMSYLIAPQCSKILKYDKTVYLYRKNMSGITSTGNQKVKCIDTYWITELMLLDREKLGLTMDAEMYEKFLDQIALNFVRTEQMTSEIKSATFFLTVDLYEKYAKGFATSSKYRAILEKALQLGDYSLYQQGCKILWNKTVLGIE